MIHIQKTLGQIKNTFEIEGTVSGMDSGYIELIPVAMDKKFGSFFLDNTSVKVSNAKFKIKGRLSYPHAFYALFKSQKIIHTEMFFIQVGKQYLKCDIDSIYDKTPEIKNSFVNTEFIEKYNLQYRPIQDQYDSFLKASQEVYAKYGNNTPEFEKSKIQEMAKKFVNSKDSFILAYSKSNPDSYIGLWQIVERFSTKGYNEKYETAYSFLSSSLKKTKTGTYLSECLLRSKITVNGKMFPKLNLQNNQGQKKELTVGKNKYTLIDFWYSHCSPCIAEFPLLLDIYKTYKEKGFSIIGVSTDGAEYKKDWQAAIQKYNLEWEQLWDKNGFNAEKLFIHSFPTNFLLDNNGVIIMKNIKPNDLKIFLEKNF